MSVLTKKIKDFMTSDVIALKEGEMLKDVFQIFDSHGIVGAPVVDDLRQVLGMVTESDLIKHFTTLDSPRAIPILGSLFYPDTDDFNQHLKQVTGETAADVMTSPAVTIEEDSSLQEAIELMYDNKVNRLPVIDSEGKLVGLITQSDVIHQLAKLKIV